MLSNFLEDFIKYDINGSVLEFKALGIDDMFKLLSTEKDFIFWLFEGLKTENGKILEDEKEFTDFVFSRYPLVVKTVIALCYIEKGEEKMSLQKRVIAIENISVVLQLEIFAEITKKTFGKGVFSDVKKMERSIQSIKKTFNLK
jgi:hypothetical protein